MLEARKKTGHNSDFSRFAQGRIAFPQQAAFTIGPKGRLRRPCGVLVLGPLASNGFLKNDFVFVLHDPRRSPPLLTLATEASAVRA